MLFIWQFASDPPEPTADGQCPAGVLETSEGVDLLSAIDRATSEDFGKPLATYRADLRACACPEWFDGMLNADVAMSLEICRFSRAAFAGRGQRTDKWIATEREAHAELKGVVK